MGTLRYVIVDVFSDRPLCGNPLAVFTNAQGLSPETMQALARELNLSETTFVLPPERGGTARVRIFTPRAELSFAGHPTLGTACVLGGPLERDRLLLELGVGDVPVTLERQGGRVVAGWLERPAPPELPFEQAAQLLAALGLQSTTSPVAVYDNGPRHAVVQVAEEADVEALHPDNHALTLCDVDTVDAVSWGGAEARLRVFAPAHGVAEDAATGSAAGPVFCHLQRHAGLNASEPLTLRQGSNLQRPATIVVRQVSPGPPPLLEVGGAAVVVARGEFSRSGLR